MESAVVDGRKVETRLVEKAGANEEAGARMASRPMQLIFMIVVYSFCALLYSCDLKLDMQC